jgi:hypothetical protein
MIKLNWWEVYILGAAAALLQALESNLTNQVEITGLQDAIAFIQKLLAGQISGSSAGRSESVAPKP